MKGQVPRPTFESGKRDLTLFPIPNLFLMEKLNGLLTNYMNVAGIGDMKGV